MANAEDDNEPYLGHQNIPHNVLGLQEDLLQQFMAQLKADGLLPPNSGKALPLQGKWCEAMLPMPRVTMLMVRKGKLQSLRAHLSLQLHRRCCCLCTLC